MGVRCNKLPEETRKLAFEMLLLGMKQTDIVKKLRIGRRTLCTWIEENPEIREEVLQRNRDTFADIKANILEAAARPIGEMTAAVQLRYIELICRAREPEIYDASVRRHEYELGREDGRRQAEEEAALKASAGDDSQDNIEIATFVEVWHQRLLESAKVVATEADSPGPSKGNGAAKPNGAG